MCAVFCLFRARQKPQIPGFGAALSFCADLPDSAEKKSPAGCLLFSFFEFFRKKERGCAPAGSLFSRLRAGVKRRCQAARGSEPVPRPRLRAGFYGRCELPELRNQFRARLRAGFYGRCKLPELRNQFCAPSCVTPRRRSKSPPSARPARGVPSWSGVPCRGRGKRRSFRGAR